MSNLNIFCFGFGQVAKTFIQKLKLENFNINLSATSRKKTHTLKFDNINYINDVKKINGNDNYYQHFYR